MMQHIRIKCVKNNQKSWEWNVYPKGPRYKVTRNNPDVIDATLWTGSRSVRVRLEALARFYP
jgi:hypothetical protein